MGKNTLFYIILALLVGTNIYTFYLFTQTKESLAVLKVKYETIQKDSEELVELQEEYVTLQQDNEVKDEVIKTLEMDINTLDERLQQVQRQSSSTPITKQTPKTQIVSKAQPTPPKANDDSPNSFTVGSSQAHVKKIMGSPDSITSDSWWYGNQSWVRFDDKGLVKSWYDRVGILKTN